MDFTREPVIETIVTPKEGCKIVVRNSKGAGQEEYFVDAVEVVSFGNSFFFRSVEKPKAFLLPVTDYEILEVREARLVLKSVGADRSIKIAGGKKVEAKAAAPPKAKKEEEAKKREKKRPSRRRKTATDEGKKPEAEKPPQKVKERAKEKGKPPEKPKKEPAAPKEAEAQPQPRSLLPPPPSLISETIARYKSDELYQDAFITEDSPDEAPPE